jgi:hypothetical protein
VELAERSNITFLYLMAWSNDPESYASSSIATGSVSHAGQVKGDDPDEKGYPGPPGWGLGHGTDNPIPIK